MARRIKTDLAEELFQLWLNGDSLWDLYILHKDTSEHFSYRSLLRLKEDQKWEDRRRALIDEYRRRNNEDILIEKRKAQFCFSMLFDMLNEVILTDYKKYLSNPE